MSRYEFIIVVRDGQIGIIVLNRPEKYNAWMPQCGGRW